MKKRILLIWILLFGMTLTAPAAEGAWTRKANMPTARYVLSTGVVDGKVYAFGGDNGSGKSPGVVEEYDPAVDHWTKKTDMPIAIGGGASSMVNGMIYIIGGLPSQWAPPVSSVQVYDAMTDTWFMKADMPTARGWLSTSVVNGKIYAIGGALTFDGTVLSTVEEYDPSTDTWTRKADMPTARACLSTSVVNGKIYAIGGTLSKQWSKAISTVEEYDPQTDTWTKKNDMLTQRSYFSTSVVNKKIYAVGGSTANYIALSSVERYDPATDTWVMETDMPTSRWGLSTSAVNGKIYAIGGRSVQGTPFSTVEEYDTGLTASQPDFNGDGIVDIKDLLRLIESWGQDDSLVDIAPLPFGDNIVDALDLDLLMTYWEQPVDDPTLIAHWALDETDGAVAYDSAGANDASVIGEPVWRPEGGKIGGSLAFDGIDDRIFAQYGLNPADGPFSVFAWIQGGVPEQVVISQFNGANWLAIDPSWGCLMTELRSSGRGGCPLQSEIVVTDGTWHRVGFVWDGSYRTLYVDDILVVEDTQKGLESSIGGLNIGCGSGTAAGTFWSGLIDDIRIYNRALRL
jgi:N-acetylneuraminic acid mutarotase